MTRLPQQLNNAENVRLREAVTRAARVIESKMRGNVEKAS